MISAEGPGSHRVVTVLRRPPVRQSTVVRSDVRHTFGTFVSTIGAWWPVQPFSAGQDRVRAVTIEQRQGGRVYETWDDGTEEGTGRSNSFDEIRIDRHADGRIVESWWIPDRFTLWQQLGLLPEPLEQAADSAGPEHSGVTGTRGEARPVTYTGEAALPAVTDGILRDALQGIRPFTVCTLKAGPSFQEPGPARESRVAEVIWEHGKRNYALYLAGLMRIVCPIGDGTGTTGVCIFDADADEVDRIMRHDPGVKAGLFTYEIHPTQTFPESRLTSAPPAT